MLWVYINSATNPEDMVLESGNGESWRFFIEAYNNNIGGNWGFRVTPDLTEHQANSSLSTGTWYHLAITYNKSSLNFYLNGSANGSVSESGDFKTSDSYNFFHMGRGIGGAQGYPDVNMYDIRFYNRALTAQEVDDIYNSTYFQIDALVTSASTATITSSKYLSASMWQHLTFVYINNQYMELYINGECEAKTLLTTNIPLNFTNTLTMEPKI